MPDREAALQVMGEPGWRLLIAAGAAHDDAAGDALRAAGALAQRCPDESAAHRAAALELVTGGAALAAKLGLDERLLAVREAVEQASSGRVATWHAQQLPSDARVIEVGCGCGADSLALAHRVKNLYALDLDPVRAACTHQNLMAMDRANARAEPGDGLAALAGSHTNADAVFLDPARRSGGRRSLDPETWNPPLSALLRLAEEGRTVYAKLAPSLDAELVADRFDVRYVSCGGECVEAFVTTARPGVVEAVLLPAEAPAIVLSGSRDQAPTARLGETLYVPDPAAVRAHLLAALCEAEALALVDSRIAYLTGSAGVASPWLTGYRVLRSLRLHPARVARALRELAVRDLRVHTRGVAVGAPELARRWARAVDRRAAGPAVDVFATRVAGEPTAILTERSPPERPVTERTGAEPTGGGSR